MSPVTDTGDVTTKRFDLQQNKYAAGTGVAVLWIRGATIAFDMHDNEITGPAWSIYTTPVTAKWQYVQASLL